jgi:hypothetical protein
MALAHPDTTPGQSLLFLNHLRETGPAVGAVSVTPSHNGLNSMGALMAVETATSSFQGHQTNREGRSARGRGVGTRGKTICQKMCRAIVSLTAQRGQGSDSHVPVGSLVLAAVGAVVLHHLILYLSGCEVVTFPDRVFFFHTMLQSQIPSCVLQFTVYFAACANLHFE